VRGARLLHVGWSAVAVVMLAACSSEQSALSPSGDEAERVSTLFWVMTIGGTVIMVGVVALAAVAVFASDRVRGWLAREPLVIGGGLVFPAVTLTALLAYGLTLLASRESVADTADEAFATITGEQWWWRIVYMLADGSRVETANELRVPVGTPVALALETADVLHSFWVPNLAGKLDMVPGRTNVLTINATKPGVSRGQCAEYCGGAHAFMAFHVVAMPPAEFDAWLAAEAGPAVQPGSPELQRGAELFIETGCGACHTIRGTAAAGAIGPDLTHVGGRRWIAAATLPSTAEAIANWIRNNQHIKPENKMPPFDILSDADLALLARYLESLE
jgi:cytochrome c oxidase subunit II